MTAWLGVTVFILSALALIYVYLISPRLTAPADTEPILCDFAHRGLWTPRLPENSMSAFELAARRGKGIELDIQATRDGRIVVFHDDDLFRMCGVKRRVRDMTLAELRTLTLNGTRERIPTLAEVLRLVDGRVPLLIEIKGDKPDPALCRRTVDLLDGYRGAFAIESFSPLILGWFRKYRPSYARGQLVAVSRAYKSTGNLLLSLILSNMLLNFISRPDFLAVNGRKRRNLGVLICRRAFNTPAFLAEPAQFTKISTFPNSFSA